MSDAYNFTDRMEAGRQVAMDARNRGRAIGNKRVKLHAIPIEDTPENRLYVEMADLRRELANAQNTIAQFKLQGSGAERDLDDFGAEFDKLVGRQDCRPAGPIIAPHSNAREGAKGNTMTNKQYLAALKKLGLTPSGKATAAALGLSLRQCQRIAAEDSDVPETLAKLLEQYLANGLPKSSP